MNPQETLRQAVQFMQAGQVADAERLFKQLLRKETRHVGALNLMTALLAHLGRFEEAEPYVKRALQENATSDATHYNHGIILKGLKRPAEALESFNRALAINDAIAATWNSRGAVLNELKRFDEALADFEKATALAGNYAEAYYNKGKTLSQLRSYGPALAALDAAIKLNPQLAQAWFGRAAVLADLKQYEPALAAYSQALSLAPQMADAWFGRGKVFVQLKRHRDALADFDKALSLNATLDFLQGDRITLKKQICDWADLKKDTTQVMESFLARRLAAQPFTLLSLPTTAAEQLNYTKVYVERQLPAEKSRPRASAPQKRIRLAYLSADFCIHATAYLIAGVFEEHDRVRFETFGFSLNPSDGAEITRRIETALEHFIYVGDQDDRQIVELMRKHEIDILVDLKGFTQDARPDILAARVAPIQVNYLGYPGTMGASFIDYLIADHVVIPPEHRAFFSEHIVRLPDSYQSNDAKRAIAEQAPTRAACGLPERGFVFCCFNNAYKLTPEMFDVWMRMLQAVDGSVLWLMGDNEDTVANLRREAARRNVAPERLIFAPRAAPAEHLARHRNADLFLDTLPYNAHTTASDALWAGLPVLTCVGETFAGRVAASLLKAAGLDELITQSLADYETLALALADDPARLKAIKEKLAVARDTCPLFDTRRFTRHLEAAYQGMWERYTRGVPAEDFAVTPLTPGA